MKVWDNCRSREIGECPYFRSAIYHSGYTGKSGEETWNYCAKQKKYLRFIKKCAFAGSKEGIQKAKDLFVEEQACST